MKRLLLIASCFLLFVAAGGTDAQAQCAANEFPVYNFTNCSFDYNIQYGTPCNYVGSVLGTVAPNSVNCEPIPTGNVGYVIRVYGYAPTFVTATVGQACIVSSTVGPVADCNSGNSTASYSSSGVGACKIY